MNLQSNSLLQGNKYKIEKVLGQGGFGVTYQAIQAGLNRKVAIKEFFMKDYCNRDEATSQITVGSEGSRELVERFRNKFIKEAQMIADFKHPNIIRIFDIFEENNTAYYVMEYIDGGSLKECTKGRGISEREAVGYVVQIVHALDYIHQKKIAHLDVKPSNILIDDNQTAILIDFGISKHYDDAGSQTTTSPVGRSKGFAPLEQYQEGGVTEFSACTDVYSLGATLYFLLSGKTPPEASEIYENGLPELPTDISTPTRFAIKKAMQPKRKDRPQNIGEFLELLVVKPEEMQPKMVSVVKQKVIQEKEEEATIIDVAPSNPFTEKLRKQQEERKKMRPVETVQPKVTKVENNEPTKTGNGKKVFWGGITLAIILLCAIISTFQRHSIDDATMTNDSLEPKMVIVTTVLGECKYMGEVDENDYPHGHGVAIWEQGEGKKYDGEWIHGNMDGKTTYIQRSGDTFVGTFKNNRYHEGRYTIISTGEYFKGIFRNGQPYIGMWYDKNGKFIKEIVKGNTFKEENEKYE